MGRSNQVGETTWLTNMNAQFDMPNAIVGHVWLAEKNCEEILIKHNQHKLFRGVRSKPLTSCALMTSSRKARGACMMELGRTASQC